MRYVWIGLSSSRSAGGSSIVWKFFRKKFDGISHEDQKFKLIVDFPDHERVYEINDLSSGIGNIFESKFSVYIIVFSIVDKISFQNCFEIYSKIKNNLNDDNFPCILCGNKTDLENRQVSIEEAQEFAKTINATYVEMSAKTCADGQFIFDKAYDLFKENRKKLKS